MPTFSYEAMNSVGQPVKGTIDAASSQEAVGKIRAQGEFPTKVKAKAAKKGPTSMGARGGGPVGRRRKVGSIPKKHLTQFTLQLSTLIDAGDQKSVV